MLLYEEEINMLEGSDDTELGAYLDKNPRIIPLFEIDILENTNEYVAAATPNGEYELDPESLLELSKAQEMFGREMEISRQVMTSTVEDINVGSVEAPLSIAKDLTLTEKTAMTNLQREYKDMFAWSHDDMKGLDPKFYQHRTNLATDAKPVQQRHYRMNPNYAAHVKEEIDKLLKFGFIRPVKQASNMA